MTRPQFNALRELWLRDGHPFTGQFTDDSGTQRWCLNGEDHREHGPAIVCADGSEIWCRHGKIHREDGPAIILANGHQEWRIDGLEPEKAEIDARLAALQAQAIASVPAATQTRQRSRA